MLCQDVAPLRCYPTACGFPDQSSAMVVRNLQPPPHPLTQKRLEAAPGCARLVWLNRSALESARLTLNGSGCYKGCLVHTKMKRLVSTVLGTSDFILPEQPYKSRSYSVCSAKHPDQPCQLPNGQQHPCSKSTPTPPVSATPKPRAGGAGIPLRTPINRRPRACCRTCRDWIPSRRDSSVNLVNWPRGFCAGGGIRIRRG